MSTLSALRTVAVVIVVGGAALLGSPESAAAAEVFCTGGGVQVCPGDGDAWCQESTPNCYFVSCEPVGGPDPWYVECAPG